MNQILITRIISKSNKIKQFKTYFIISIIGITVIFYIFFSHIVEIKNEKIFSDTAKRNYDVYKLFAKPNNENLIYKDSDILGTIIIPKININYPFFYGINEDLLKIAPCHFLGNLPDEKDNLCIAGHNYDDDRFFSKIYTLDYEDLIIIENNSKKKYYYFVYDKFEIDENQISFVTHSNLSNPELTLLTCNNRNNKRIVVKAKTESP